MLHGLIFDLGSTLLHFSGEWGTLLADAAPALGTRLRLPAGFADAYREALHAFFHPGQQDWVPHMAAHTIQVACETLRCAEPSAAEIQAALAPVLADGEARFTPFPDAVATLTTLRAQGYRLALVTNAHDAAHIERLLNETGLRPFFDPVIISATFGFRKPNPRIFRAVAEQWDVPPATLAVVGDMLGADILGAQLAGMRAIWAMMDAHSPANAAHRETIIPDATLTALADLPPLLAAWVDDVSDKRSPA